MGTNFYHHIPPNHPLFEKLIKKNHAGYNDLVQHSASANNEKHLLLGLIDGSIKKEDIRLVYHLGKSSCGWAFDFRGYEEIIESLSELKSSLKSGGEIYDEYGDLITPEKLINLIKNKVNKQDILDYATKENCFTIDKIRRDDDGHCFCFYEFS